MTDRILIVDDDAAVLKMLYKVIVGSGFEADTVESGEDALVKIDQFDYAALLLDINLHGIDGFEVIENIRKRGSKLPIIIISGRKDDYDTIYGLKIGADDYITKPFNPVTLGAKVKALIRRNNGELSGSEKMIYAGVFTYDTSTLRFYKNEKEIVLTGKENSIMKLFMDNVNHVFSKDMLYELIWGNDIVDDNAIMVYINKLRQKIEDDPDNPKYIQTIRGIGYRFIV